MALTRPPYLAPFSLAEATRILRGQCPGVVAITMSLGQWDVLLEVAYDSGCVLLELDRDENLVGAYRRSVQ